METFASNFVTFEPDSSEAARAAGAALLAAFGAEKLGAVLVYATVNHDQPVLLESLRAALGPAVALVGCSVQGLASGEDVTEGGFALGVMGFGGDALRCATGVAHDIGVDSGEKGRRLGRGLASQIGPEAGLIVLLYDPFSGVDVEALAGGVHAEIAGPIVGGGAANFGRFAQTYQYQGDEVLSRGVVALALSGPFAAEIGLCQGGMRSTGAFSTVTRSDGNRLFELDGRRAVDCWREATGLTMGGAIDSEHASSWALSVERAWTSQGPGGPTRRVASLIRSAFAIDEESGALTLLASITEGSRVEIQRRSIDGVIEGSAAMGNDLTRRLAGRRRWAVLGFECGARTVPFLGQAGTRQEHQALRRIVAPEAPWLGMIAFGEIAPLGREPAFHNFSYPLVVLTEG